MRIMKQTILLLAGLMLLTCAVGCGDSNLSTISEITKNHVKKVAILYKAYSNAHQFQGPENEAELKAWAQGEQIKTKMIKFGVDVDKFDSYMLSDRNGDKLEIRWGVKSQPMAPPYPVVYETTAVDGIRLVGMAGGRTLEVDNDEDYARLKAGEYNPDDFDVAMPENDGQ